jgi:pimeloyl-ACP methyl ester carboxylesterase
VARLVLCDCPAFDYRPVPQAARLAAAARFPFFFDLLCDTGLLRAFARSRFGYYEGAYVKDALPEEAVAHYIAPLFRDTPPAYRASRERFRRAVIALIDEETAVLLSCVEGLRRFAKPTLVVWGCDDPYISTSYGKKLADEIPGCSRLELIPFCGHWVPEERPAELATLVAEFAELAAARAAPAAV